MESHGGNVELLSLEDGVARIHLRGSCSDCSASSVTLELAIKQALEEAAPDLEGLEVEGVAPQTIGGPGLPMVTGCRRADRDGAADGDVRPAAGAVVVRGRVGRRAAPTARSTAVSVAGSELVVANVEGTLLAYRDRAPAAARRCTTAMLSRRRARVPAAASGRSSCRGPGARWTTSGSSSSRCRCCASTGA